MKILNSRLDIASRAPLPKQQLFRLVNVGGTLLLDEAQCLPGRGIYLKKDRQSIAKARQKNLLAKASKGAKVADALYQRMEELC